MSESKSESTPNEGDTNLVPPKKKRYNGIIKKRQWVDYRAQSDGNDEKRQCFRPEDRVKRRKYCLLMGYAGANYFGMQRNPEVNTIEEVLLAAMLKQKWISDEGYKQPQMVHFQRAARTDKGVSAARQCISLKLPEELNIEALNEDLPKEIKVFGVKRVTKGFNAKDQCNARTYSYTLPTISFARFDDQVNIMDYRVPSERIDRVNEMLKLFHGNKNFHNFTARKFFSDPSSFRLIYIFECGQPYLVNNVEFATIVVKGQSFMLHQIRKMIGLTLAVVREVTTSDTILRAFKETRIDVPMAPGLGLVLDQVHYDRYNSRYGADGFHENLVWDEFDEAVQKFRENFIQPKIAESELEDKPMLTWLSTLELHSYDERVDKHGGNVEGLESNSSGGEEGISTDAEINDGNKVEVGKTSHDILEEVKSSAEDLTKSSPSKNTTSLASISSCDENIAITSKTSTGEETSKTAPTKETILLV